ncbi:MAG: hypothetical protein MUE59_06165 [Thiobacillaceae bacterium]|nr:hypothetical protein [Thiobacillaceae bacterium]
MLLPPAAWSSALNVRFASGAAQKMLGHSSIGTPSVAPYGLVPVIKSGTAYWVYPGLAKAYSWDGTTHTNITRQTTGADVDYTGAASDYWNGGVLNGVLVLNNGKDAPQMWVGSKLEALTWDGSNTWAAKGYTAKVLRPYKNFLVAMNWDDGVTDYPQTVYWSNQADPGAVPSDWDFADPANEAGTNELAATQGYILDGEQLRDAFVIYKEDMISLMQYVGGAFVMNFRDVSKTTGALAQRCTKEFYGKHFVLCQDDVIVHDGQNVESVISKRMRRALFSAIDPTYYSNSFVARNLAKEEMWLCFTETGQSLPSRAAVWSWRDGTWSWRELPSPTHIAFGVLPSTSGSTTWDSDGDSWDADSSAWGERSYNPASQALLAATSGAFYKLDDTEQFAGAAMSSYLIREGLLLDGQPTHKMVRAIYPRATGGAMSVSIGHKWDADDSYSWEGPYTFTPATDHVVRVRSTGRFHAVKFEFPGSSAAALHGYDLEFAVVGGR